MSSSPPVLFEGFVTKQGGSIKTWKRRWMILTSEKLTYQDRREKPSFIKEIPACKMKRVVAVNDCHAKWPGPNLKCAFGLGHASGRTFNFYTDDEEATVVFQTMLNVVILQQGNSDHRLLEHAWEQLRQLHESSPLVNNVITCQDLLAQLENLAIASSCPHTANLTLESLKQGSASGTAEASSADEDGDIKDAPGHGRTETGPVTIHDDSPASRLANAWEQIELQTAGTAPAVPHTLEGRYAWRTVRVFVSSTFADMYAEREVLVRQVFPRLRAWAQIRRIRIIECDLRWGVVKDSDAETVFRTCLGEIDRCIEADTNPFFINLLGHRYGWVPVGDELPLSVAQDYSWPQGISITHMEVLHGAYRTRNPNAAFFVRSQDVLSTIPDEHLERFQDQDEYAIQAMAALKDKLRGRFEKAVYDYSPCFDRVDDVSGKQKVLLTELDEFEEQVYGFLTKAIEKQYPLSEGEFAFKDKLANGSNWAFDSAPQVILGRETEIQSIMDYIEEDNTMPTVSLLVGERGVGRGTILVEAVRQLRAQGRKVLFHDANASSACSEFLLRVACEFLPQAEVGLMEHRDGDKCAALAARALDKAHEDGAAITFAINGIDVLVTNPLLASVFAQCVGKIKFIGSFTVDDIDAVAEFNHFKQQIDRELHLTYFKDVPQDEAVIEVRRVETGPLPEPLRAQLVLNTLESYNKRLDDEQLQLLIANEGSRNCEWLKIVCEELRVFGVFETLTARISEFKPTIPELILQVWDRIREEDSSGTLVNAMMFIVTSYEGVYEDELLLLLGSSPPGSSRPIHKREPLPMTVWAPIYLRLRPLLRGGTLIRARDHLVARLLAKRLISNCSAGLLHSRTSGYYKENAMLLWDVEDSRSRTLVNSVLNSEDASMACRLFDDKAARPGHAATWPHYRTQLMRMARCHVRANATFPGSKAVVMCQFCAGKPNPKSPLRLRHQGSCFTCGGQAAGGHAIQRNQPFQPQYGVRQLYLCSRHAIQAGLTGPMIKCHMCKKVIAPTTGWFPVIECGMCGHIGEVCCHWNR
eukprot:TRINITY_DN12099_c1_g1_i8.p1 TRINITY_DN12099_c1_g1~~TRINITY_DN12099_c1_g1_i8.p1  ORF type:complete len:1039 (+),score=199.76 TRINITY_DN12099_c1_g1_i8:48-3164(+)